MNDRIPQTGVLADLSTLAMNVRWSWHAPSREVLRMLDPERFDRGVNPIEFLYDAQVLERAAADEYLIGLAKDAASDLMTYLGEEEADDQPRIAYFCAEYGLHESLAQYSGGLGILAGDHCKEASDMALPFVAIGCFYRLGFFRQVIGPAGTQEHLYPEFDPARYPVERVLHPETGDPLTVTVELPGRDAAVAVWRMAVGRVPLLLLDTALPQNSPGDQSITAQLYMATREMRLTQELVLGVGGVRALRALELEPDVYHLNEGHSAMLLLERLGLAMQAGLKWKQACEVVQAQTILTIHTPVPAGNERFDAKLTRMLVGPIAEKYGLPLGKLMELGIGSDGDKKIFDMTAFALRLARGSNGVSILHGETADATWKGVAKGGVGAVTNGVHLPTWIGPAMEDLVRTAGDPMVVGEGERPDVEPVLKVAASEVWASHRLQKRALIAFAGERMQRQARRYGTPPAELDALAEALHEDALLIGFARRFATYKRASLLFSEAKEVARLFGDAKRPVQILFAGKAHPADTDGQALIAEVIRLAKRPGLHGKVFFLEDYDMAVGRMMVQGVDLWLNNPRRPLEASGTSGMKAAMNGVPNVSILDGWWDEGYDADSERRNGYAIGGRTAEKNDRRQDKADAKALIAVLRDEVIPAYFDRDNKGVPQQWVKVMKRSMASSLYSFSTRRMLRDYLRDYYRG